MANNLLTPQMITREALRILHQKLNFIGSINRQYDERFANDGAKIGDTLQLRLPNQYTIRSGPALSAQDTVEQKLDLVVNNQKGVDINFGSAELTLSLDDYAERILEPAMAVLAANIEADAMVMYKDVYQQQANLGSAMVFKDVLLTRKQLTDSLTPTDNTRCANVNTQDAVDVVDALKGLFQDSGEIAAQYREGMMGRTGGYNWYENTLWPQHTTGSNAGTGYTVNGASQTGNSLIVQTGTGTLLKGDVFTIAGVNMVHPESRTDTGKLQQFVVTADTGSGAGTWTISPAITPTGARQNVTASPADAAAITKVGGADASHGISMFHHRDAFAFATADLIMPQGVDFASREVLDGISMRIVRQYDINSDNLPCRVDVLYGYKAIRAQLACRGAFN